MRVRPSLLVLATALSAFFAAQTALGSTGPDTQGATVDFHPVAAPVAAVTPPAKPAGPKPFRLAVVRGELAFSDRPGGPSAGTLGATTEFGSRHVLGVTARRGDWLGVVSSARPNGALAWVRRGGALTMQRTRWSLRADLSERSLTLRRNGRAVRRF